LRHTGAVVLTAGLFVLAVGLSSCGVPVAATPQRLSTDLIPKALSQPPSTDASSGPTRGAFATIYLLNSNNKLIDVTRSVRKPVTPQDVINVLEQGPTNREFLHQIGTAIPASTNLRVMWVNKSGEAAVALDALYFNQQGEAALLELAQVVESITSTIPSIRSVQFYWNGIPSYAEVAVGFGELVLRPVTAKDYASLLQPSS
jgi:hypothetical protein